MRTYFRFKYVKCRYFYLLLAKHAMGSCMGVCAYLYVPCAYDYQRANYKNYITNSFFGGGVGLGNDKIAYLFLLHFNSKLYFYVLNYPGQFQQPKFNLDLEGKRERGKKF